VPLDEGIICSNGRFRYLDGNTGRESSQERLIQPLYDEGKHRDWVIPLVQRLVGENKQVVVFRETTGETRHGADYLAQSLGLPPATEALSDLPTGDPSQSTLHWRQLLARGVAFHNSHLRRDERRVIVATTTLAMGVNTPASAVSLIPEGTGGPWLRRRNLDSL
jgi:helicase